LIELNAERNVGIDEWAPPTLASGPAMTRADALVIVGILLSLGLGACPKRDPLPLA